MNNNDMLNWEIIIFIMSTILICIIILFISYFLGGKSYGRNKHIPFESGIVSTGNTKIRFSTQFYLVAMFFVIFDVESIYLYAWSLCIKEAGWIGFIEASIFIFLLFIGLIYLIKTKALNLKNNKG